MACKEMAQRAAPAGKRTDLSGMRAPLATGHAGRFLQVFPRLHGLRCGDSTPTRRLLRVLFLGQRAVPAGAKGWNVLRVADGRLAFAAFGLPSPRGERDARLSNARLSNARLSNAMCSTMRRMNRLARRRFRIAVLALFCLLFQQAALAGYACPLVAARVVTTGNPCTAMGMQQARPDPVHCQKSCTPDLNAAAHHDSPSVPPLALPPPVFAPVTTAAAHARRDAVELPAPADPPPRLRFCSLLI